MKKAVPCSSRCSNPRTHRIRPRAIVASETHPRPRRLRTRRHRHVSARFTGDIVSKELGEPLIVENRPGGSGSVGIEATIHSPADGYTLFVGSDSAFDQPVLRPKLGYRWEKDLKPITILTIQPIVIVVNPAPGWKNIGDLVKTREGAAGRNRVWTLVANRHAGRRRRRVLQARRREDAPGALQGWRPGDRGPRQRPGPRGGARLRASRATAQGRARQGSRGDLEGTLQHLSRRADARRAGLSADRSRAVVRGRGACRCTGGHRDATLRSFNKALSDTTVVQRLFAAGLEVVGGSPAQMAKRMAAENVIWSKAANEAGLIEK